MFTPEERRERINRIRNFPAELEARVKNLTRDELMTHFIEGEWTVAQNVLHVADSHMNAYIRTKLIQTENHPPLKGYNQDAWAELVDGFDSPLEDSFAILRGLHHRWVMVFESLSEEDWKRSGIHSENGEITIEDILKTYSEHGAGHIDQINRTLEAGKASVR
jgi:DinB family protein